MIDPAKITAIIIFESKTYVSRSKHRNRKRSGKCYALIFFFFYALIKKDISNKKHIDQMDFAEYLRKSEGSENSKVYCSRFLRNGFHERYC